MLVFEANDDFSPSLGGPVILGRAFGQEFGLLVCDEGLTDGERVTATWLEARYRSRDWTWRR